MGAITLSVWRLAPACPEGVGVEIQHTLFTIPPHPCEMSLPQLVLSVGAETCDRA